MNVPMASGAFWLTAGEYFVYSIETSWSSRYSKMKGTVICVSSPVAATGKMAEDKACSSTSSTSARAACAAAASTAAALSPSAVPPKAVPASVSATAATCPARSSSSVAGWVNSNSKTQGSGGNPRPQRAALTSGRGERPPAQVRRPLLLPRPASCPVYPSPQSPCGHWREARGAPDGPVRGLT